jgi:DNA-binding XRE family transcriptional regulator
MRAPSLDKEKTYLTVLLLLSRSVLMPARPDWSEIAPRLRAAREAAGLTVFEACQLSGVQPASLYAYEAGATEPKSMALLALCRVYSTDPLSLVA